MYLFIITKLTCVLIFTNNLLYNSGREGPRRHSGAGVHNIAQPFGDPQPYVYSAPYFHLRRLRKKDRGESGA